MLKKKTEKLRTFYMKKTSTLALIIYSEVELGKRVGCGHVGRVGMDIPGGTAIRTQAESKNDAVCVRSV